VARSAGTPGFVGVRLRLQAEAIRATLGKRLHAAYCVSKPHSTETIQAESSIRQNLAGLYSGSQDRLSLSSIIFPDGVPSRMQRGYFSPIQRSNMPTDVVPLIAGYDDSGMQVLKKIRVHADAFGQNSAMQRRRSATS